MEEDQDSIKPTPYVADIVTDYNYIYREIDSSLSHVEIIELLMLAYNIEKDDLDLGSKDCCVNLQPLNTEEKD